MITDARSNSFATKRAPDDPGFERPESATKLDAVVHVINFRIIGIAQMHIFGRESEKPAQTPDVAHVESAEIKRDKEHLVRVDDYRIRFVPAGGDGFAFRHARESRAVRDVDVQPHSVFAATVCDLGSGIAVRG